MYQHRPDIALPESVRADLLQAILRLNIAPGPGGSRIVDCTAPEITDLFASDGGFLGRFAVAALWPSAQIVAHRDAPIAGIRHHVPLQMNAGCWVFHDGTWQQLEVGKVYRMDPTQLHGAVNWGATLRLHLIVDVSK